MKRIALFSVLICLAFASCEKEIIPNSLPPEYFYNSFCFAILDAELNNVCMLEDFNQEELLLEYEGKTFKPIYQVLQKVDDNDTDKAAIYNAIYFEKWPKSDEYPAAWRIYGHTKLGVPVRYIIRYRDNKWVVDFKSEKRGNDGKDPDSEAYVNGIKIEEEYVYNNKTGKSLLRYVLYTK